MVLPVYYLKTNKKFIRYLILPWIKKIVGYDTIIQQALCVHIKRRMVDKISKNSWTTLSKLELLRYIKIHKIYIYIIPTRLSTVYQTNDKKLPYKSDNHLEKRRNIKPIFRSCNLMRKEYRLFECREKIDGKGGKFERIFFKIVNRYPHILIRKSNSRVFNHW